MCTCIQLNAFNPNFKKAYRSSLPRAKENTGHFKQNKYGDITDYRT